METIIKGSNISEKNKKLEDWDCIPKNSRHNRLIYGIGPGITYNKGSQGIRTGAGTIPIKGGIRADGKFLPNNIKMSKPSGMNNKEISQHIKQKDLFDENQSSIKGRYWTNKILVQDDDSPEALKPGKADTSPDPNVGQLSSIQKSNDIKSVMYDPMQKSHPSDGLGTLINMLSQMAKKEITKKSNETIKTIPQNHHQQKVFQKEINMKELPIPHTEIPVNFQGRLKSSNKQFMGDNDKIKIDDKHPINSRVQINNRVPININISYSPHMVNSYHKPRSRNHRFYGYGTPNLCDSHENHKLLSGRCPKNKHRRDHGYTTLQDYYDLMSAENNVQELGRQWKNRDYLYTPTKSNKPAGDKNKAFPSMVGQPYAPFMNKKTLYEDKAKEYFNNNK